MHRGSKGLLQVTCDDLEELPSEHPNTDLLALHLRVEAVEVRVRAEYPGATFWEGPIEVPAPKENDSNGKLSSSDVMIPLVSSDDFLFIYRSEWNHYMSRLSKST